MRPAMGGVPATGGGQGCEEGGGRDGAAAEPPPAAVQANQRAIGDQGGMKGRANTKHGKASQSAGNGVAQKAQRG